VYREQEQEQETSNDSGSNKLLKQSFAIVKSGRAYDET
jgi:hypothetical protein